MKKHILMALVLIFSLQGFASAKGYLVARPKKLPDLILGVDGPGFQFSQTEYRLETGQAYKLEIEGTGKQEYAFKAPDFFNFIWLRKVEAGGIEIKATHLYELEFEGRGKAEIFFVPIKPGKYEYYTEDFKDNGMVGHFIVE